MRPRHCMAMLVALAMITGCSKQEAAAPPDPLVRKIDAGNIRGVLQPNGTHAWLGIPFAKPPVNELRWQAPQPVAP